MSIIFSCRLNRLCCFAIAALACAGFLAQGGPTPDGKLYPQEAPDRQTLREPTPIRPGQASDPGTDGTPFAETIPSQEIVLDHLGGTTSAQDFSVAGLGSSTGEVCALTIDNTDLLAYHSPDSGSTFGAAVNPDPGDEEVQQYRGAINLLDESVVHVVYIFGDPNHGTGLRYVRSDDMCQTWTAPLTLVGGTDAEKGIGDIAVASNTSGTVAVTFTGNDSEDVFTMVSTDNGSTFGSPVQVDTGGGAGSIPGAVANLVDELGNIHVAFVQYSGTATAWYTRSVDSGATFSPETNMSTPGAWTSTDYPVLASIWDTGGLLMATWADGADGAVQVLSSDDGSAWTLRASIAVQADTAARFYPTLFPAFPGVAAPGTVEMSLVSAAGELKLYRSADRGVTWDAGQTLATTAAMFSDRLWQSAGGRWVVGWDDARDDSYLGSRTDIYARSSPAASDGIAWDPEQRVDTGDTAGSMYSFIGNTSGVGGSDLIVIWADRRDENGTSANAYINRFDAGTGLFGTPQRLDSDGADVSFNNLIEPCITTDGASAVYAAMSTWGTGPESDIYVSASTDGGYTFGAPVRVGDTIAGERVELLPVLSATPGGNVYLLYYSDTPASGREIRFNRSTDFGSTWAGDTVLLTMAGASAGYFSGDGFAMQAVEIPASDDEVHIVLGDGSNILYFKSTDGGATFAAPVDLDPDYHTFNTFPHLCVQNDQVVVAWQGADIAISYWSVWGMVSTDRGATWPAPQQLRPEVTANGVNTPYLGCDGDSEAAVAWPDFRSGVAELFVSFFSAGSWAADGVLIGGAPTEYVVNPQPVWTDAGGTKRLVVSYKDNGSGGNYSQWTGNYGSTWSSPIRLDAGFVADWMVKAVGEPGAAGANLWVSWLDHSPGQLAMAMARSTDGGVTFGPPTRLDTNTPQGVDGSFFFWSQATSASLPGSAFFVWAAPRDSLAMDILVNADDLDDQDRDQTAAGGDCDDADPNNWISCGSCTDADADGYYVGCDAYRTFAGPDCDDSFASCTVNCTDDSDNDGLYDCADACLDGDGDGYGVPGPAGNSCLGADCDDTNANWQTNLSEIANVHVGWSGTDTEITWGNAGAGVLYDIAKGSLQDLRSTGAYGAAVCEADQHAGTTYIATLPDPPSGDADWFLVRAQNGCGTPTYGDSGLAVDPRDDLDSASPCP